MERILLVEDDEMIADIYLKKLGDSGFEVENAKTGKEVLKFVSKEKFDLVLLDMVLPEMSGMDVLKEIKKSGNYDKSTRIFIFSNLSKDEVEKEALENGAEGMLEKNKYTPSALVDKVKEILR